MDRAQQVAYAARVVGIVLFAAGIGGAVLGAYAPLQQTLGLCGGQTLQVSPIADEGGSGSAGPGLVFEDLSAAERSAFETALDTRTGETRVTDDLAHGTALSRGATVAYRNETYRFAVVSENRCVTVDPQVLPLGLVGVVLGGALYGFPSLRERRG